VKFLRLPKRELVNTVDLSGYHAFNGLTGAVDSKEPWPSTLVQLEQIGGVSIGFDILHDDSMQIHSSLSEERTQELLPLLFPTWMFE
jgi:hypothetical protein